MGYQVYKIGNRYCGYGVPSYCEHPDCNVEIDRGFAHACGGEPASDRGCGRYFCELHKQFQCFDQDGFPVVDSDECYEVCERCAAGKDPFPYKKEHPEWRKHLLLDTSWSAWRQENPSEVEVLIAEELKELPDITMLVIQTARIIQVIMEIADKVREEEQVICAAIKTGNGVIVRGHRHNWCFSAANEMKYVTDEQVRESVQGFVTSKNRFVDRMEAMTIAIKAGQVSKEHEGTELSSEDLY